MTKKTTIKDYVDLYSGPEIEMYFKYSNALNLVFICMTHCVALPILVPITFVGLLNNFVTERVLLARYYKHPPLIDNKLN